MSNWRIMLPLLCVLLVVSIPPMVKRLHDRGRDDVWAYVYLALAFLPPAVMLLTPETSGPAAWLAVAALFFSLLVWLAIVIDLGFLRGTNGPNAYGEEARMFGREEAAGG